jgi:hypothetical protein
MVTTDITTGNVILAISNKLRFGLCNEVLFVLVTIKQVYIFLFLTVLDGKWDDTGSE